MDLTIYQTFFLISKSVLLYLSQKINTSWVYTRVCKHHIGKVVPLQGIQLTYWRHCQQGKQILVVDSNIQFLTFYMDKLDTFQVIPQSLGNQNRVHTNTMGMYLAHKTFPFHHWLIFSFNKISYNIEFSCIVPITVTFGQNLQSIIFIHENAINFIFESQKPKFSLFPNIILTILFTCIK